MKIIVGSILVAHNNKLEDQRADLIWDCGGLFCKGELLGDCDTKVEAQELATSLFSDRQWQLDLLS